jgi:hypothetical protein
MSIAGQDVGKPFIDYSLGPIAGAWTKSAGE